MLKKLISVITITTMLLSALCVPVSAEQEIKVCLNHEYISMSEKPKIVDNRVLIPLRAVAENIGCDVEWDNKNKMAVISTPYAIVGMQIGNTTMSVETRKGFDNIKDSNKTEMEYETVNPAPMIIDGSTYIPMRSLVEALTGTAEWDGDTKTVYINCHAYNMMLYAYSKGTMYVVDDGEGHGDIMNYSPTYTIPDMKTASKVVIDKTITSIGAYNFQNGANLEEIMFLNGNLVQIGEGAFRNCTKLKEVVIPDGVKYIERSAFENCTSLESVTIPSTLEFLGKDAFAGCTSLKNIECSNPDVESAVKKFVGLN